MKISPRSRWTEFWTCLGDGRVYHMDAAFGVSIESRVNINGQTFGSCRPFDRTRSILN
jgi:hypothetical protein